MVFSPGVRGGEEFQAFFALLYSDRRKESAPRAGLDLREAFEELREAVTQAEVFAVGSSVLADECDFAGA